MSPSTAENVSAATAEKTTELDARFCRADEPVDIPGTEFFRFYFSTERAADLGANTFQLFLKPLSGDFDHETWFTDHPATISTAGQYRIVQAGEHLAIHTEIEIAADADFFELTHVEYGRLLREVQQLGYTRLLRAWNYFPGINEGQGDEERYKLFAAGRGTAFDELGYSEKDLPAGTAIGTAPGTPFTITVLATRHASTVLENPRQTSAYKYPREFGPRGPSFSRAVMIRAGGSHQVLISGTASIVGYESRHLDDAEKQLIETLKNLKTLLGHAIEFAGSDIEPEDIRTPGLRVYLRNRKDYETLRNLLNENLSQEHRILFLEGDICRSELALEIELTGKI